MLDSPWTRMALVACVVGLAPSLARAQEIERDAPPDMAAVEARALFDAGRVAFAEGRFEDALRRFQGAHEASGHPELLYNVAMCLERLQRDEEALGALRAYLEQAPDSPLRGNVEGRIEGLERSVAEQRALAEQARREPDPEPPADPGRSSAAAPEGQDLVSAWWLWTLVGVVVVGAALGVTLALTLDPGEQAPIPGDAGIVVSTLVEVRW